MADATLFLDSSPYASISCKIHPVVVWSILDHFMRRSAGQERVIGALLGINFDGLIEIRSCFGVPHNEKEEVRFFVFRHISTVLSANSPTV